jgi:HlyD family secretion protein
MDREIPQSVKRKRVRKRIVQFAAVALGAIALSVVASLLLRDSISRSALVIGVIDSGNIEISVAASGRLVPLVEEIIVSPINSRILEIYKSAGNEVAAGEPLLRLDLASVETEYRQKLDEREIRRSRLIQQQVRTENSISELTMQQQIKEMRISQLENELASERHLDSIGASTRDRVRHAELAYGEARLELQQMAQRIENERRASEAELNIQRLELSIFEKSLQETARLLEDARILSPSKATLTFINNQIGAQVTQGTTVAIVADLTRFKVEAEISDGHRDRLSIGSTAVITIGNVQLNGTVVNISPSILNGIIEFTVIPEDSENPSLRSGLRADVHVLYGRRQDVLRIPNRRQFGHGRGHYFVWVVNGDRAERRRIGIGDASHEYYEVTSGLAIGDEVILSDMERFSNRETIRIR